MGRAPGADHGEQGGGYAPPSPLVLPPGGSASLPPRCQHSGLSRSFSPLCFKTGSARLSVTCCWVPGWRSEVSVSPPVPARGAPRKPVPRERPEGAGWPPGPGAWGRGGEPAGRALGCHWPQAAPSAVLRLRAAAGPACFSRLRSTHGVLPSRVFARLCRCCARGAEPGQEPPELTRGESLPGWAARARESPAVLSTLARAASCRLEHWLFVPHSLAWSFLQKWCESLAVIRSGESVRGGDLGRERTRVVG